jgi:hypothetical protein
MPLPAPLGALLDSLFMAIIVSLLVFALKRGTIMPQNTVNPDILL